MADKLMQAQIKFHIDKITALKHEIETRRHSGERRIWKMQLALDEDLEHLENQVMALEQKLKLMQAIISSG